MKAIHFWDGSHIACGQKRAELSTEAPGQVSCRRCRPAARAAERAWQAADAVADGTYRDWALVPLIATSEMIEAGNAAYEKALLGNRRDVLAAVRRRWAAMCAAAPKSELAGWAITPTKPSNLDRNPS